MSRIENCVIKYKYSQRWESLTATDDIDERHCSECQQTVYACSTDRDIAEHVRAGHCIAIFGDRGDELFVGEMTSSYNFKS